ncbi:FHA domain-containing protein [bacterium]|nr:FHA domain-containing protein [bacterium]
MPQPSEQLTFRGFVARYRAADPPPTAGLLVEVSGDDPQAEIYVLGHQTTENTPIERPSKRREAVLARPEAPIHLLVKSTRNPFEQMVTVGRAENNDVVVKNASVSKFHAYFRVVGPAVWVHDAGSSNGTWLEGRPVGKEGAALSTLGRVSFGQRCEFLYVAPGDIREWIQALVSPDRGVDTPTR